jgi:hypothetical protein
MSDGGFPGGPVLLRWGERIEEEEEEEDSTLKLLRTDHPFKKSYRLYRIRKLKERPRLKQGL